MTTQSYGAGGPAQARPLDIRQALEASSQAMNAHDVHAFASFYADNAVVVDPQYPEPLRGLAAIEQDAGVFTKAFPDLQFSITSILVEGRMAAGEGTISGTNTGPLPLPSGEEIPATGRRLEFPMAFFSRFDEAGKIVEERRYYDLATQQEQLGLA
ncbi:ester cyclase [Arthrobacter sp. D1-29]